MANGVHRPSDPEAPDDAIEEADLSGEAADDDVPLSAGPTTVRRDPEVPEADALEQARDVPYDDEYGE
jgi:hypothetical protein